MNAYAMFEGPLGRILLVSCCDRLTGVYFCGQKHEPVPANDPQWRSEPDLKIFLETSVQLHEYFAGRRRGFDIKLHLQGTPFQMEVWSALREISFGATLSYAELACRIGSSKAARAVGAAVGRNPISIIVPCHRVIGSTGALTGYAGGLERKRALLELEGAAEAPLVRRL